MLNPYFLLGIGITILALVTGAFFEGEHIQATADTVAVDRLKIDAAAKLADANAKTLETERARDALKDELEKAHAIHQASIDADHARNRAAIDALGWMRVQSGHGGGSSRDLPASTIAATFPPGAFTGITIDLPTAQLVNDADAECRGFLAKLQSAQDWAVSLKAVE